MFQRTGVKMDYSADGRENGLFNGISLLKFDRVHAMEADPSITNPILKNILTEGASSMILYSELARLMIPKIQSIDHEKYGLFRKMIEIPETTFKGLLGEVQQLTKVQAGSPEFDRIRDHLNTIVNTAFDLPLKSMLWKMNPMVKEFSTRLSKKVELKIAGSELGLSRLLLYDLRDAFVHMIRNALDHGIETPAQRLAAGKPEMGTILISCKDLPDNQSIELLLNDDGAGVNVPKLVSKAVQNELITQAVADSLSPQEKINLIFLPNLSTKDDITDISGRGVGMDAVKTIITKLHGRVEVVSTGPQGTQFRLIVPKTLVPVQIEPGANAA